MVGSVILSIFYGIEIKSRDDVYLPLRDKVASQFFDPFSRHTFRGEPQIYLLPVSCFLLVSSV
jgi:hypothetical protein